MLLSMVSMLNPGAGLAVPDDCEKLTALSKIRHSTRRTRRIRGSLPKQVQTFAMISLTSAAGQTLTSSNIETGQERARSYSGHGVKSLSLRHGCHNRGNRYPRLDKGTSLG